MIQPHNRNRHPKYRKKYKTHKWRAYERSLINRQTLPNDFQTTPLNLGIAT